MSRSRHISCARKASWSAALAILTCGLVARADTHYVDVKSSNPKAPYTSPKTAAGDIQAAVDAAAPGDTVQVAPGTYNVTSPILVKQRITLQGAGADKTTIDAGGRCRCVTLQGQATLKGFTITRGRAREGAGVHCGAGATITGCTIADNQAERFGGGVCVRIRKSKAAPSLIEDCRIVNNRVTDFVHTDYPFGGGGIYVDLNTTVRNCRIEGNEAAQRGGGVWCHNGSSVIENCIIVGNRAKGQRKRNPNGPGSMEEGGGGAYCDFGGQLRGCLLYGNHADRIGGGAVLSTGGRAKSCTIVGNTAGLSGAGVQTLGVAALSNSIVYGNTRRADPGKGEKSDKDKSKPDDLYVSHYYHVDAHQLMLGKVHLRHCRIGQTTLHTTRRRFYLGRTAGYDPARYKNTVVKAGLTEGNPGFLDAKKHDYRLRPDSPCIDAGTNEEWMTEAKDLAGQPRIQGTTTDIGAHERPADRPHSR